MLAPRAAHATSNTETRHLTIDGPLNATGSPCNVSEYVDGATHESTKKPKKKRVRRAKLELEFLRRESVKLEDELAQLLKIQAQRHENPTCVRSAELQSKKVETLRGYRLIAPCYQRKPSVWQEIAERQSKERRRAFARNSELRAQLELEFKLERQLMQLLARQYCAKEHIVDKRIQSVVTPDDGFKALLERAENTPLDIKKVLRGHVFNDTSACFLDTFVEKEDDHEIFAMQANVILPFGMKATANALWTVLSSDNIDEYCYFHQVAQKSENAIAQAFGIRYTNEGVDADFRGIHIFTVQRRRLHGDRVGGRV